MQQTWAVTTQSALLPSVRWTPLHMHRWATIFDRKIRQLHSDKLKRGFWHYLITRVACPVCVAVCLCIREPLQTADSDRSIDSKFDYFRNYTYYTPSHPSIHPSITNSMAHTHPACMHSLSKWCCHNCRDGSYANCVGNTDWVVTCAAHTCSRALCLSSSNEPCEKIWWTQQPGGIYH